MLYIIDGYNLIKSIFKKERVSAKQINWFIKYLSNYANKKNYNIIIIFDGYGNFSNYSEHGNLVKIIYSEYKSADQYIKDYILEKKIKDAVIVTSDSDIIKFANYYRIKTIDSLVFYENINKLNLKKKIYVRLEKSKQKPHKLNFTKNNELDELMEEASNYIMYKIEDFE